MTIVEAASQGQAHVILSSLYFQKQPGCPYHIRLFAEHTSNADGAPTITTSNEVTFAVQVLPHW